MSLERRLAHSTHTTTPDTVNSPVTTDVINALRTFSLARSIWAYRPVDRRNHKVDQSRSVQAETLTESSACSFSEGTTNRNRSRMEVVVEQ